MKVKLGDVYPITSGGTPSRKHTEYYTGGTIPWVKTGDLKDKYLFKTEENITEIGLKNSSAKLYPKDTVLLAMYGATIGAVSILKKEAATNQACAAFIRHDDILPEYLYAFLESQKSKFVREAVGGAQPNISATYLKRIYIPLLLLDEQRHIATVLDKVSDLIALRKKQLAKLDELVKARFVEMFGDPISNSKKLPVIRMKESCFLKAGITTDADKISDYSDEYNIPCFGGNGIRGYVKNSTQEGVYPIIGRQGALCGNVCLAKGKFHATEHAVLVTPLQGQNIIWLFYLLKYLDLYRYHTGAAQPGLSVKTLNLINILDVCIVEQNQFASFAEAIDKQKIKIELGFEKLETLKKSLMQEYFG